jgi:hypothetical protein
MATPNYKSFALLFQKLSSKMEYKSKNLEKSKATHWHVQLRRRLQLEPPVNKLQLLTRTCLCCSNHLSFDDSRKFQGWYLCEAVGKVTVSSHFSCTVVGAHDEVESQSVLLDYVTQALNHHPEEYY